MSLLQKGTRPFAPTPADVGIVAHSYVGIVAHSYCFDFSVWEMYTALLFGAALVVPSQGAVKDPARFFELLREPTL